MKREEAIAIATELLRQAKERRWWIDQSMWDGVDPRPEADQRIKDMEALLAFVTDTPAN